MNARRHWTADEKQRLLQEATTASISAVAKRYGISRSLIFRWRKEFSGSKYKTVQSVEDVAPTIYYRETLKKINKVGNQIEQIGDKLFADLNAGLVSSYNVACGFASLTNSLGKIRMLTHDTVDKLKASNLLNEQETSKTVENEHDLEMRRIAEQCLLRLVTDHILPQQQPAEDVN